MRYEEGRVGPDYRVYEGGACVAGVEVLSLFQRQDWSAEEKRHWRLADALNARVRPTQGYFVHFEIEQPTRSRYLDGLPSSSSGDLLSFRPTTSCNYRLRPGGRISLRRSTNKKASASEPALWR